MARFTKEPLQRDFTADIEKLDSKVRDLKIQYERYFSDAVENPPAELEREVQRLVRTLQTKPFKQPRDRFRLNGVVQRYQSYKSYWARNQRARETGTFSRDLFKEALRHAHEGNQARDELNERMPGFDITLQAVFETYHRALAELGQQDKAIDFDDFSSLIASKLKEAEADYAGETVIYKIVMRDGEVDVDVSPKANLEA